MPKELPIYSDAVFRGSNPFASLDRARGMNLEPCLERFDQILDHGERSDRAGDARHALTGGATSQVLVEVHRRLFPGREEAGSLRTSTIAGVYPGQDCPEPEHLVRSLGNLEQWLAAESFAEMHPVEQAALSLTRLVDIWPFDFGNRTAAVVFSNQFLLRADYPPFFVLGDQIDEFEKIMALAIRMNTEPLVRAMYKCMERELELAES